MSGTVLANILRGRIAMRKDLLIWAVILLSLLLLSSAAHSQGSSRVEAEKLFVEAQKALSQGDNETAETLLMKALQKDSSFTSAIWQLSQIYEKRGKLEYARELLLRGLQQQPDAAWAREKLSQMERALIGKLLFEAESYMSAGEYNKAIPKLSLYLGIKPYDPTPLIRLGRCHLALGNMKSAREYLIQALERDPSNPDIAILLDEVDARLGKPSVEALVKRAQSILASYTPEKEQEARASLQAILNADPANAWAREKLGELDLLVEDVSKRDVAEEAIEKGKEALQTLKEPATKAKDYLFRNLTVIILIVVAILLVFDIRKRTSKKSYPLQGTLSLIPVLDIVSLLNSNLKTGRLVIMARDTRGEIFLEKGEIIHARWKDADGKKAFKYIMELKAGTYFFNNHLPSIRHTISEPLSLLLLSLKSLDAPPATSKKKRSKEDKITADIS